MKEIQNVTIIGVGVLGGSLGLALKRKGFSGKITGVSREQTLARAQELGVIDCGFAYHDIAKACEDADVIYLCTPINRIRELIGQLGTIGSGLKKDCIVTDVGSTKSEICRLAAEKLPVHLPFIGGHPMAGSEKTGIDAADPFLFENAIYVLTPGQCVPAAVGEAFSAFTQKLGANVILMQPEAHDRIAAVISHVPQLMAVALMNWAAKMNKQNKGTLQLAAGGFRDMTRIASSAYSVWKDIIETNQDVIEKQLEAFIKELDSVRIDLRAGKLEDDFCTANSVRNTIPKDTKGFLRPLPEILVLVDDRPGVVAEISTALAKEAINIKDIEVLKIREGEGGTLRMGFESMDAAQKAVEILKGIKYEARIRE